LSIFSIILALTAFISAWNTVVWSPKLKICPLLEHQIYTPAPVSYWSWNCVPDLAPFVWVEPVLPFTGVRKINREWIVKYISGKHPVRQHMQEVFVLYISKLFGVTGFRSLLLGIY
jgi:hypothetical protein